MRSQNNNSASDQSICENGNASFSVTASGHPVLTFQWYKMPGVQLAEGGRFTGTNLRQLTFQMLYWVMPEAIIVLLQMAILILLKATCFSVRDDLPIGPTLNVKSPNLAFCL